METLTIDDLTVLLTLATAERERVENGPKSIHAYGCVLSLTRSINAIQQRINDLTFEETQTTL